MYPPRPASTTTNAIVDFSPRMDLSSPPPRVDAGREDGAGDDENRQPVEVRLLRRRQRDAAIVGVLGTNGNEILLLRQPADGVHEKVLVALDAENRVRREIRIADDDDACFRLGWFRLAGLGRRRG